MPEGTTEDPALDPATEQLSAPALRKCLELVAELNRDRDPELLLEQILDAAIELVGAERGFLVLTEQGEPGLELSLDFEVRCARNFDGERIAGPERKVSRSILSEVLRSGRTQIIESAAEHPVFSSKVSVRDQRLRSVIAAPLLIGGQASGAIYMDNRFARDAFGRAQAELMEMFATQASLALTAARRLQELASKTEELERLTAELAELNQDKERIIVDQRSQLERLDRELDITRDRIDLQNRYRQIRGESEAIRRVLVLIDRVADEEETVLITGETGTGKELVARALHTNCRSRQGPFVGINCAALSPSLLESELFGHLKGSWTGALREREGLFAKASGGTLFLDEVTELPLDLQAKLLRVLQEREVRPIGADDPRPIDVRVVAASNRDLQKAVAAGQFREDLYYRLRVIPLALPALRDRGDDVALLATHFLEEFAQKKRWPRPKRLTRGALFALEGYRWPGNIRQLRNAIERACLVGGETLTARDFADVVGRVNGPPRIASQAPQSLEDVERQSIAGALRASDGNVREAARILGIHHSTLYRKIKRYGLESKPRPR